MKDKTKWTPTPWAADSEVDPQQPARDRAWITPLDNPEKLIAMGMTCEDANHVVHCVNGHDALRADAAALALDVEYYKWRLKAIIPLFQEARDALPAISMVSAQLRGINLSLGDRMDEAGTATRADFDAAREGK